MSASADTGHAATKTSCCAPETPCSAPATAAGPPNTAAVPEGAARTRLYVAGLCCDDEVALIHRRLDDLEGVFQVQVNVVSRQALVRHDVQQIAPQALADRLNEAKLEASVATEPGAPVPPAPVPWLLMAAGSLWLLSLGTLWVPALSWAAGAAALLGLPPIAAKAWVSIKNRLLDMNVLMTLAIVGALAIGEWVEAATVVVLFGASSWLERRAMDRARQSIGALLSLAPETAERADGTTVPAATVRPGDLLVVRAGARIPVDGTVESGRSAVDESALTGESMPVDKEAGDALSAGTVNQRGVLAFRATAKAEDSAVSRLVRLVEEAQAMRSPSEQWVDRFARVYTPVVVLLALSVALLGPWITGEPAATWLYRALVLLVVACPCALVLSTPVTVVSALARAARDGVLIKGGVHLEALAQAKAVAFDKTGTLTQGRFAVVDCLPVGDTDPHMLHRLLMAAEHRSSHPLAAALVAHAETDCCDQGHAPPAGSNPLYRTIEGEGIAVLMGSKLVQAGNHRMAERLGWCTEEAHAHLERWQAAGRTVVYLGVDGVLMGMHSLADVHRPQAPAAVSALSKMGLHTAMLTGDNPGTAHAVAQAVGVDEVHAELRPKDKVGAVQALSKAHGPVIMVGDGINDAPALAAAHVGVAMGARGTAVALETADVALMGDDLARLPEAIALGRRAATVIRRNVGFALVIKAAVLVLGGLGLAQLWMAVAADVGASLLVVLYGLSLLRKA